MQFTICQFCQRLSRSFCCGCAIYLRAYNIRNDYYNSNMSIIKLMNDCALCHTIQPSHYEISVYVSNMGKWHYTNSLKTYSFARLVAACFVNISILDNTGHQIRKARIQIGKYLWCSRSCL